VQVLGCQQNSGSTIKDGAVFTEHSWVAWRTLSKKIRRRATSIWLTIVINRQQSNEVKPGCKRDSWEEADNATGKGVRKDVTEKHGIKGSEERGPTKGRVHGMIKLVGQAIQSEGLVGDCFLHGNKSTGKI
jgi:hypothetical protein